MERLTLAADAQSANEALAVARVLLAFARDDGGGLDLWGVGTADPTAAPDLPPALRTGYGRTVSDTLNALLLHPPLWPAPAVRAVEAFKSDVYAAMERVAAYRTGVQNTVSAALAEGVRAPLPVADLVRQIVLYTLPHMPLCRCPL